MQISYRRIDWRDKRARRYNNLNDSVHMLPTQNRSCEDDNVTTNASQQFPVGALVQWGEMKTYGVVAANDGKKIEVRWDDASLNKQFSAENSTLSRVDIAGKTVQRRSNCQDVVALIRIAQDPPVWACSAFSPNGITNVNVPESDLFIPPVTDPVERFKVGEIGSTKRYLLRQVAQRYRMQNSQDDLVSLGQSQVDIKPHQVSVVHKVAQNYPHRFMLCDEVGLGKTIEAGMALKELRAKSDVKRVLVIAPPNLVRQWQFELKTKFNETFSILNTTTVNSMRENGYDGNPFAHPAYPPNVICSSRWVSGRRWRDLCVEAHWDMIILDEAHHARRQPDGSSTALYKLVRDLAPDEQVNRPMLFLTATPMQLNTSELYALVEILDPTLFPSEEDFDEHRKAMPGLSSLAQKLSAAHEFPMPGDDDEETERTVRQISEWLDMDEDDVLCSLRSGGDGLRAISEELSDKHRLSEVMIRNRKSYVGGFMPRSATRWEVELSPEERAAMDALEDYVRVGYQFAEDADAKSMGFVMVIFQKLTASSIAAIRTSLLKRREKVRAKLADRGASSDDMAEMLDQDASAGDVVEQGATAADFSARELVLLNNAIVALDNVGETDSKAHVFVDKLAELFGKRPDEKVLVFTQFRETQSHLADLLKKRGWNVNEFHGGMNARQKDAAIQRFKTNGGPQILISTEAGGEGRNLQFCHLLVNYDLPWNPMKVEQRIGRIDRIGQDKPILIFNLWVKDTVEERVLDVLENRIQMFEETVGGLDPILGDEESVETSIEKIMMTAEEEGAKEALDNLDRQIETKRRASREAGTMLGDFIMDTKSYRREIMETISGQKSPVDNANFEKFIQQLLLEVNTRVEKSGDAYELTFRGKFVDDNKDIFISKQQQRMKAVLRPDRIADASDAEGVVSMLFGHSVVERIVERVLSDDYEGNTGARRIVADDRIRPDSGWLFHYRFTSISGTNEKESLEAVFVSDSNGIVENMGELLVERACRLDAEKGVDSGLIPDNLAAAEQLASNFIANKQRELQREEQTLAAERVDGEVARLNAFYDQKEREAQDKMDATRATLNRIRESGDERQKQILPALEANLRNAQGVSKLRSEDRKRRIAEAEAGRNPSVDYALKALGRIEIVASA